MQSDSEVVEGEGDRGKTIGLCKALSFTLYTTYVQPNPANPTYLTLPYLTYVRYLPYLTLITTGVHTYLHYLNSIR